MYEGYINGLSQTLLLLKNEISINGLRKEVFEDLLLNKPDGLKAILILTRFSNESLMCIITIARIVEDKAFTDLLNKSEWNEEDSNDVKEWSETKIQGLIKSNEFFRKGLVNLFFEGGTIHFLQKILPLFELKKWCSDNFSGARYKPHRKIRHTVFQTMFSMFLCGSTQNLSECQKNSNIA